MQAAINSSLLTQLKPSAKQYDVRDSKLRGFLIRVNPSGKMNYVCEYKRGRRINLGGVGIMTPAQARDRAKVILGDAAKGISPNSVKKQPAILSLRVFVEEEYQPWVEINRKTGDQTVARIKACFYKLFANKPIAEITSILIDQWRTKKLKAGRTTNTINRDVATLKAVISKAVEWNFLDSHPLAKLKPMKTDNQGKIRYLSIEEEKNLRNVLDIREVQISDNRINANKWREERNYPLYPDLRQKVYVDHLKPMVLLAINTGMRRGEIFSLTWENVDFDRAIVTIEGATAKSGKTRHIPLNSEALKALMAWKEQSNGAKLVFMSKNGNRLENIKKSWGNLLAKADIQNFRFHDLRHHFASRLVMAGVDLNTVRELLGHADIKMTLRYAHLALEHKSQAVARLLSR